MKKIVLKDGTERKLYPTQIMGIINVTEDSFYAGSRVGSVEAALIRAEQMVRDGAVILDIGGESTRPGSLPVTPEEEVKKICPVIKEIRKKFPDILISADTYRASTAAAAIDAGADIINDVSGLKKDPDMIPLCAKTGVPVVIMHSKGDPEHMQDDPHYEDVVKEVYSFLQTQMQAAMDGGIPKEKIIIDVGIGFGKTLEHNMALLRNIGVFNSLDVPHLMAVSRKTWIGALIAKDAAKLPSEERLYGTIASTIYAYIKKIELVRVHDVKENAQALYVFRKLMEKETFGEGKEKAVIALGSNIGDRRAYLEQAIALMEERAGHIVKRSSVIETKAYGYTDQADFLNMAILLETTLSPHGLLAVLHDIEAELDRTREVHWGPRTIDLDIIFYGDHVINDPELTIPHPDYSNRDFVLQPVKEIVPGFTDPATGSPI